jgi:hypothetical protein
VAVVIVAAIVGYGALRTSIVPPGTFAFSKTPMPFADAQSIVAAMRGELPAGLAGRSEAEIAASWEAWSRARDAEIRTRLARGDEDSVVHLWLFGTSFTSHARATETELASIGRVRSAALVQRRLDDLIAGLQSPGDNDRLLMARQVLERAGIDLTVPDGRVTAARHLEQLRQRQVDEMTRFGRDTAQARETGNDGASLDAYLAYYRDRGLSSDTSLLASYSIERALAAAVPAHLASPRTVRRVAIVGPGLDFVDKAEGLDFYPQQTLQPFALVDSLVRVGLSHPDGVELVTFDISPRVVNHLQEAARRVERGTPYVVTLPLDADGPSHAWDPGVAAYWREFGGWIGAAVTPRPLPQGLERTRVRAVQIRSDLVTSIRSTDLNIILERLAPGAAPFDLIIATNILVYYAPFEQALALANISAMLRPGGLFLTNTLKEQLPAPAFSAPIPVDVVFDRRGGGDTLYWFRRQ